MPATHQSSDPVGPGVLLKGESSIWADSGAREPDSFHQVRVEVHPLQADERPQWRRRYRDT